LEILWLEGWSFLLTIILFGWWLICLFIITINWSSFGCNWWWHCEFFIDNLILSDELGLNLELEANDGSNLSDDLLNTEKLVHESQLELVIKLVKLL
jgi:hypothetical protein